MNLSTVTDFLGKIANAASGLSPIAGILGIGKNVTDLIDTGLAIGKNVIDRVEDGTIISNTHEKADLDAVIAKLEATNAELDKYIRNS